MCKAVGVTVAFSRVFAATNLMTSCIAMYALSDRYQIMQIWLSLLKPSAVRSSSKSYCF